MVDEPRSDYDSAWKEALNFYFEPFMAFCFAETHRDINWSRGYETLDAELQEVIRDAETGRRLADKLVKVSLNDGEDVLVLVHVEIQGQVQSDFAERMYIYNHRLFVREAAPFRSIATGNKYSALPYWETTIAIGDQRNMGIVGGHSAVVCSFQW